MPIVPLIDHIHELLQQWFYERCILDEILDKLVTIWMEEQLQIQHLESLGLTMKAINLYRFEVDGRDLKGIVNHVRYLTSISILVITTLLLVENVI